MANKGTGIAMHEPIYIGLHELVHSTAGRAACIDATSAGKPALVGLEPLITGNLRREYRSRFHGTATAGGLIAHMMRAQGYELAGRATMPEGSIAKTAAIWRLKA